MTNSRRAELGLKGLGFLLALATCQIDQRRVELDEAVGESIPGARDGGTSNDAGRKPGNPAETPDASGAVLELVPSNLEFGSAVVGFAAFRRVTVKNAGGAALTELGVGLAPESAAALAIAQNQCPTELGPGASCDVRLQFLPAELGTVSGALEVASAEQSGSVPLSGTGLEPGDLLLLPAEGSSADFGAVSLGSSVEAQFRIDNPANEASGPITFDLANPAFVLLPPAAGECEPGVTSLPAGAGCVVRVAFEPMERGLNEATLTATSENLGSISLGLRGNGLAPAALAVDAPLRDFGGVVLGSAGRTTVYVSNAGDEPLTLASAALDASSDPAFSVAASSCGAGVVLGGPEGVSTCSVELEFRPTQIDVAMGALAIAAEGGLEQSVTLRGEGLLPGSLVIEAEAGASTDFGELVIGEALDRRFRVSNPGEEPSGTIELIGSGGFEPLAPAAADECAPGVTTLAGGESCFVNVRWAATTRGPIAGSLTVSSALAGSTSLELQASGLLPATLVLDRDEVDFGRVVRGTSAQASLLVRNDGDVPLPAPTISLGSATSGQASAFGYDTTCSAALDAGAECSVTVSFAPAQATPHSVTLNFTSDPGGSGSVLLVARVIEPGSLVLQPAAGSSADFGDVAINTSATREFVLTNPGGEASGRITLSTNDARFSPSSGDCNAVGDAGLVDGASCTFTVTFTPLSSEAASASLTATSTGAGSIALPLTGRGRNPARLAGSNDFNFNTVILGESATPRSWTVTNQGDLPTGTLTTTGANQEFTVTSDTCAGRSLPGGQSCTLLVGFAPQGNGARSGLITVADAGSSVTLTVRGTGQALPGVGAPCLDGRCAGSASCENHSNGQSRVCCAQNCAGNQRCSQGQNFQACELPTVGQGQPCGANVLCEAGLGCNGTTGTCCASGCNGPCRFCNTNGSCGTVADGQRGGCAAGQVCAQGACGECTPGDRRCNPANPRIPQLCSATGSWQNQPACQFVCGGGFCSGECVPNSTRCDPVSGRPQLCSSAGTWTTQAACGAGASCSGGGCVCSVGFETCGAECADLTSDPDHCGDCGRSCFPGQGGSCSNGNCTPAPLASGENSPRELLLGNTHVYWINGLNMLRRVPKAGGAVTTVFTGERGIALGLSDAVLVNNQLYFSSASTENGGTTDRLMRSNLDGTNAAAFSPAYSNLDDQSIDAVAASNTFVFHAVLSFLANTTTFFRSPLQGAPGAGNHTNLGTITGRVSSFTAAGDCLYYTASTATAQIIRRCAANQSAVHHVGAQAPAFRVVAATDANFLYFREGTRVSRIGLGAGSTATPFITVNAGLPSVDPTDNTALYYFAQTGALGAPACTREHTLFRTGRTLGSGNPVVVLPPPHECPTQVLADAEALYWANNEGGTVMKVGK